LIEGVGYLGKTLKGVPRVVEVSRGGRRKREKKEKNS